MPVQPPTHTLDYTYYTHNTYLFHIYRLCTYAEPPTAYIAQHLLTKPRTCVNGAKPPSSQIHLPQFLLYHSPVLRVSTLFVLRSRPSHSSVLGLNIRCGEPVCASSGPTKINTDCHRRRRRPLRVLYSLQGELLGSCHCNGLSILCLPPWAL